MIPCDDLKPARAQGGNTVPCPVAGGLGHDHHPGYLQHADALLLERKQVFARAVVAVAEHQVDREPAVNAVHCDIRGRFAGRRMPSNP